MSDEIEKNPENGNEIETGLLANAPLAIVAIDTGLSIKSLNVSARTLLGAEPGDGFGRFVQPDSMSVLEDLLGTFHRPFELGLNANQGSKVVEAIALPPENDQQILFLSDISEKIALSRQLRSSRAPTKKTMNHLHAATTTMLGYTELIAVMLDEEPIVSGDRLTVVKRYHREVRKSLDTIDRMLKLERLGGRRADTTVPFHKKHVVVVDDEFAISEFVAELMRGLQHRVSSFSNPAEAVDYCQHNADAIDLLITDMKMPGYSGNEIANRLHRLRADVPVVLCSEDTLDIAESGAQTFHCQKPIDIDDLTRMVSELI